MKVKGNMTEENEIIGRKNERTELDAIFDSVREGTGGMAVLSGEAGVGKTALAEFSLGQSGLTVFTGRAWENVTPPYGPITTALRSCKHEIPGGNFDCGPFTKYLALLLPELGTPPDNVAPHTLVEAITTALLRMAQEKPAALLLDDLHWADNATIELLPILVDRIQKEKFLVMATYREDQVTHGHHIHWLKNELRQRKQSWEIPVNPLDFDESNALIERLLGAAPGPSLSDLVFSRTRGLPMYVEEFTKVLSDGRHIHQSPSGMELIPGQEVPLPDNIRDTVILRMEDLSEPARSILEVAAVAGVEFDLELLIRLTGEETGLDELFEQRFIIETRSGRGAFRHTPVRETVLGEILWPRRRDLNRRIADYLESVGGLSESIAEHWLEAKEFEKARRALLDAAKKSFHVYAYRDAAKAARQALDIWPIGTDEADYLQTLSLTAHSARMSGQLKEAEKALEKMTASSLLKREPNRFGETLRSLATVYGLQGDWDRSLKTRRMAALVFQESGSAGEAAIEWLALAGRYTAMLNLTTAVETVRRAIKLAETAERWDVLARAMGMEGNQLAMQGHFEEGREKAKAALSIALKHNLTDAASEVYRRAAGSFEYASDYSGALEAYNTALNYCRTQGEDSHARICLGCMSYVLFQTGDWKRSVEICREVMSRDLSPSGSRAVVMGILGLICAHRGETREARNHLQTSLNMAQTLEIAAMELLDLWGLAMIEESEGNADKAETFYLRLLRRWETTQDLHDVIPAFRSAATFFSTLSKPKETMLCAEALAVIASATANPEAIAGLSYALGETDLLSGNAEEAALLFVQTLDYLEKVDVPLARIMAEFRAGVAYARAGRQETGVVHLTNAYRLSHKLGTRPLSGRIRAELERMGESAVEQREPGEGKRVEQGGLTRRQLEIIRLIAEGLTDRIIADRLYLSSRTVEMHVFNIFNRLDCRSRSEVVRKAGELGLLN